MALDQALMAKPITRECVENFLFLEAELLDEWRLDEWEDLLADDAVYQVPSNDCPEGTPQNSLFIIADDRERIHQRILRVSNPNCHAEYPRSRIQRMISNVRISKVEGPLIHVSANLVCYRFRRDRRNYSYVGSMRYVLRAANGQLKIKQRRIQLASEELGSLGAISFIL
ncbi:MAG TPA: aromatic-ring-hydroxylating dioxygenase subunit beta [Alphaproteobacteria bacterium]|jgi:p-cumate 2,3-dioxygenase beta subunit